MQSPFLKESAQNPLISGRNSVVHTHVTRVQPQLEPQLSIPDATVPSAPSSAPVKTTDPFHASQSPSQNITHIQNQNIAQIHKSPLSMSPNPVLIVKDEISRVTTPTTSLQVQKEAKNTPPATPRPHSSESFFQMSASPQSQLLASLESHSQPSPVSNKVMGPTSSAYEPIKSTSSVVQSSTTGFNMQANVALQSVPSSPKPQALQPSLQQSLQQSLQPSLQSSVQQFVLQQSPLTSVNIVKQLSQYKETFGSLSEAQVSRTLLGQEKPLEQQNLEKFLKEGHLTIPYSNKVPQHQQLRDLLQNKKFGEPILERNNEGIHF